MSNGLRSELRGVLASRFGEDAVRHQWVEEYLASLANWAEGEAEGASEHRRRFALDEVTHAVTKVSTGGAITLSPSRRRVARPHPVRRKLALVRARVPAGPQPGRVPTITPPAASRGKPSAPPAPARGVKPVLATASPWTWEEVEDVAARVQAPQRLVGELAEMRANGESAERGADALSHWFRDRPKLQRLASEACDAIQPPWVRR